MQCLKLPKDSNYISKSLQSITPDGNLRLSGSVNTSFWNYIVKESEAFHTTPPKNAALFIDGMALMKCLKPKKFMKK